MCKAGVRSNASWWRVCEPGELCGSPGTNPEATPHVRCSRDPHQPTPRPGRRPGSARTLGRRPDHRTPQFRDRDPGGADHQVHDAGTPPTHARPPKTATGPQRARSRRPRPPKPYATLSLRRSSPCPNSSAAPRPWDQGAEMAQHAQLRTDTNLDIYFCDPQSPWQRGTNHNTNGLLRQYPPRRSARPVISPKAPTSTDTHPPTSTLSPQHSTADPAKPSTGRPPPRPSTTSYTPSNKAVLQRPLEPGQYLSIRYTNRLTVAGIEPSVGSVGDSYDNALAESVIGLYKTELIHKRAPWKDLDQVEYATLEYVDWFNHRRLLEPIGTSHPQKRRPTTIKSTPQHH